MVESRLSPPLMMMKGDLSIALTLEKKSYLVVAEMVSLWQRPTVIKDDMMALHQKVLCHSYQLIVT